MSSMFMFNIVPIFIMFTFGLVFAIFIINGIKGGKQWSKNNASPVLTVEATIISRRMDVSRHYHHTGVNNNMHHTTTSTRYYITFQVESGDRMELLVPDSEYGMLVEGDVGRLTFQGTRYKSFVRNGF